MQRRPGRTICGIGAVGRALDQVAHNKLAWHARHSAQQRRDVHRTSHTADTATAVASCEAGPDRQAIDRGLLDRVWQHMDEELRSIASRRLEGMNTAHAATMFESRRSGDASTRRLPMATSSFNYRSYENRTGKVEKPVISCRSSVGPMDCGRRCSNPSLILLRSATCRSPDRAGFLLRTCKAPIIGWIAARALENDTCPHPFQEWTRSSKTRNGLIFIRPLPSETRA